jgi:hypothetical protein
MVSMESTCAGLSFLYPQFSCHAMGNISGLSLPHSKLPLMPTELLMQFPRLSDVVSCTLSSMLSLFDRSPVSLCLCCSGMQPQCIKESCVPSSSLHCLLGVLFSSEV